MRSGWSSALRLILAAALAGTSACTRFGYEPVVRTREPRDAGSAPFDAGSGKDAALDAGVAASASDAASGVDHTTYVADASSAATDPTAPEDAAVLVADPVPPVDAADASVVAPPPDTTDAGPAEPPAAGGCGNGVSLGGVCWYLAPLGTPCMTFCASHGAYSPALAYSGDAAQGGSAARCDMVLDLLMGAGVTQSGYRTDGRGLGCHVFKGVRWWLNAGPAFSETASHTSAQIACSCVGP